MRPLLALLPRPVPHLPLGDLPSPVELRRELGRRLGFEELLLKRDDLSAGPMGGNKVRALEWILPLAGPAVVSVGGYGSSYAASLATYASLTGRHAALALFPQPWTEATARMLARTASQGSVVLARSRVGLPVALLRAWRLAARFGRPTWVAPGAATPRGALGAVNAALEFARQLEDAALEPPDAVVVPLGSGGTAAGILVGLSIVGWTIPLYAVPVADRIVANRWTVRRLVRGTLRLLRRLGAPTPKALAPLVVPAGHLGRGYGHPTGAGSAAAALAGEAGVFLDPTYGAKAFAALRSLAGSYRRPCFWHTFDARGPAPGALASAEPLLRRARLYSEALWPSPKST